MSLKFNPEDFHTICRLIFWNGHDYGKGQSYTPGSCISEKDIAKTAQKIFDEWLAKQTVVYTINNYESMDSFTVRKTPTDGGYKARLVCITPIEHKCPTCGK